MGTTEASPNPSEVAEDTLSTVNEEPEEILAEEAAPQAEAETEAETEPETEPEPEKEQEDNTSVARSLTVEEEVTVDATETPLVESVCTTPVHTPSFCGCFGG